MKINKDKKKWKRILTLVFLFLFCITLLVSISPKEANAQIGPGSGSLVKEWWEAGGPLIVPLTGLKLAKSALGLDPSDIALGAATAINYIIGYIAGFLFWVGAQIIVYFLYLNAEVVNLPAVSLGWSISRDIANLGFVLAIIIIAISTIVRFENYGAKKALPKLIAAAILVNFSLTMGAAFVDFSNVLSGFFIKRATGGGEISTLADSFGTAFSIQNFMKTKSTDDITTGEVIKTGFAAILSIFIAAVFTLLSALTLLGIALMLLVRMIWIAVLLIISPIAWLFWIIPDLEGQFKKWWHNFLSWIFYAPILTFFLYLTLASVSKIQEFTNTYQEKAASSGGGVDRMTLTGDPFVAITNTIVLVGLLIAGLMTAKSMSMTGAQGMLKIAESAGTNARKWAGKKTGEAAKGVGRRALTTGTDAEGKTGLERLSAKYGHIPLVGRALRGASGISSKAKATGRAAVDEEYKKIEHRTGEDAINTIKSQLVMGDPKLAAWGTHAIKEGKWDQLETKDQNRVIEAMRRTNSGEKVVEYAPHLAGEFVKPADRAKAEAKTTAKLTEIPKNVGKDGIDFAAFLERNAQHISSQMIEKIGTMPGIAGDNARNALKNTYINQTNAINFVANNKTYSSYSGIENARKDIDGKSSVIENLTSKVKSLKAEMETKIATAKTDSEKDVLRKRYSVEIESGTKNIGKVTREKTDLKNELEKTLKAQDRTTSKAIDMLDKVNKDPNYK